jgi:hypothetical protein
LRAFGKLCSDSRQSAGGAAHLRFEPHPGQASVVAAVRKTLAVLPEPECKTFGICAPRGWGKDRVSTGIALDVADALARSQRPAHLAPRVAGWFVYPTYKLAHQLWEELKRSIPRSRLLRTPNESDKTIWLQGDTLIEVRSAEKPSDLVAAGLDFVVIGEAARMKLQQVLDAVRPALTRAGRLGLTLINSTPMGNDRFARLIKDGQDPLKPWVQSFTRKQWQIWEGEGTRLEVRPDREGNPYASTVAVQRTLDEEGSLTRWFRQEHLAEILTDEGALFVAPREHTGPAPAAPYAYPVVVGWDPAKWQDYSVLVAFDGQGRMIEMDRMGGLPYLAQVDRAVALCERLKAAVIVLETNGVGDPVMELLERRLPETKAQTEAEAFITTGTTKTQVLDALALGLQQDRVQLLDDPVLVNEFETIEPSRTRLGTMRYQSPEGAHDDCVMASAFAWWGLAERQSAAIVDRTKLLPGRDGGDGGKGGRRVESHAPGSGGSASFLRGLSSVNVGRRWR